MRYVTQMPPSGLMSSGQVAHLVPELKKEPKKDILRMAPRQLQLRRRKRPCRFRNKFDLPTHGLDEDSDEDSYELPDEDSDGELG